jgi:adenylate kinase
VLLHEKRLDLDAVIELKVDEGILIHRVERRVAEMTARGEAVRADDNAESLKKRLDAYRAQTAPLVDYYGKHGALRTVDGMAPIEDVTVAIGHILADSAFRPKSAPKAAKAAPKAAAKGGQGAAESKPKAKKAVKAAAKKPVRKAVKKRAKKAVRKVATKGRKAASKKTVKKTTKKAPAARSKASRKSKSKGAVRSAKKGRKARK